MSRYAYFNEEGQEVAYGFDHTLGFWFDVYEKDETGEDIPIIEESTALTRLTNAKMLKLMDEFEASPEHMELVALDLPI